MNYYSKSYSLDDDVVALMDALKAAHGSYNKGLRATLIDGQSAPAVCGHAAEIARMTKEIANQARAIEEYETIIASWNEGEIPDVTMPVMVGSQAERAEQAREVMESIADGAPAAAESPGRPVRESSYERAQRENREREAAARARSSVGDDPAYTFDPEFVQD